MKIIKKIEIKNFRSFLGTTQEDKAVIEDIKDLNIFSGSNDSGKSNVLRALNLFFNGRIDSTHEFNFETEFTLLKKDYTQKVIEIKVHFLVGKREFSISKFYDRNGYRNFEYRFLEDEDEIIIDSRPDINRKRYAVDGKDPKPAVFEKENGFRRYAARFIYWISFSYVPAIRDERFFSHLYGKIISQIKSNEEQEIDKLEIERKKIQRYERTLNNISEKRDFLNNLRNSEWRDQRLEEINNEITEKSSLKRSIDELESQINNFAETLFTSAKFLASEFKIGTNLKEFFESFDIGTGETKDISLRLRGDGVQAKFIPEMLDFLDSKQEYKKYFIWGFEEPENSAEYKNQQILAEKFKNDFSKRKQIFITTHSEEFLSIYDESSVAPEDRKANLYHVRKINNEKFPDFSVINLFDVDSHSFDFATVRADIEKDIGSSLIRAKYSKELKNKEEMFLEEKKILELELSTKEERFNEQISQLEDYFPEKIFICEDSNGIEIWESFFDKYEIENVKVLSSTGCTVNNIEIWISGNISQNREYSPKVFRNLDRDGYTQEQITYLENSLVEKNGNNLNIENYLVKFLPVNELENYAVLADDFFTEGLISENKAILEDHFSQTAGSNVDRNNNKFNTDLFEYKNKYKIVSQMRREAESDVKKYFPGKRN